MYVPEENLSDIFDKPLLSWSAEAGQVLDVPEAVGEAYEQWKTLTGPELVVENFLSTPILADLDDLRVGQVLDVISRSTPVPYPQVSEDDIYIAYTDPVEQIVRITRTDAGYSGEFLDVRTQERLGESFGLEQVHGCDRRAQLFGQTVVRRDAYLAGTVHFEDSDPYDGWLFGPISECCVIDHDDPRLTS
ncbi:MAG: hypothetical protein ACQR33_02835 [Candidatus Saccharibacteria bacterium]